MLPDSGRHVGLGPRPRMLKRGSRTEGEKRNSKRTELTQTVLQGGNKAIQRCKELWRRVVEISKVYGHVLRLRHSQLARPRAAFTLSANVTVARLASAVPELGSRGAKSRVGERCAGQIEIPCMRLVELQESECTQAAANTIQPKRPRLLLLPQPPPPALPVATLASIVAHSILFLTFGDNGTRNRSPWHRQSVGCYLHLSTDPSMFHAPSTYPIILPLLNHLATGTDLIVSCSSSKLLACTTHPLTLTLPAPWFSSLAPMTHSSSTTQRKAPTQKS